MSAYTLEWLSRAQMQAVDALSPAWVDRRSQEPDLQVHSQVVIDAQVIGFGYALVTALRLSELEASLPLTFTRWSPVEKPS